MCPDGKCPSLVFYDFGNLNIAECYVTDRYFGCVAKTAKIPGEMRP